MDSKDLKSVPILSDLSKKQLRLIARHTDTLSVSAGRVLMREGEMAMEVIIVLSGEAVAESGGEVLSTMGPGAVIGEIGVMEGLHRTATVTAKTDMELAVMFGPEFAAVSDEISELRELLEELVRRRMARGGGDPT